MIEAATVFGEFGHNFSFQEHAKFRQWVFPLEVCVCVHVRVRVRVRVCVRVCVCVVSHSVTLFCRQTARKA